MCVRINDKIKQKQERESERKTTEKMPRCYFVKKPIQQYSNLTILKSSGTIGIENEQLLKATSSSSSVTVPMASSTASVIVAISSPQGATTKTSPSHSTGLCQYICATTNKQDSQESRNGK